MTYRMYSGTIPAGKNLVEIIQKSLEEQKQLKTYKLKLKFIGFEGTPGTKFTLNNQIDKMEIPTSGNFVTPFTENNYMSISSLIFDNNFTGKIYYII